MKSVLLYIVLIALAASACAKGGPGDFYGMPRPGGVRGVLTDESGKLVQGGVVYFYTDPDRRFRGPAEFMAEPADEAGRYVTELPPGKYWAVARKRVSGSVSGNLQKGDLYSREVVGPIEVKDGRFEDADLTLNELTGNMLFNVFTAREGGQGIKGVITGRDGRPAGRAYAFAYIDHKMVGKPDYVSEWTRDDGTYTIYVLEPGVYFVGARTGYMGVPRPDEPYGRYAGTKDHAVNVKAGEFTPGVDIRLGRFSDER